ncbi:MAG: 5'/3'-nucleotidase SurE [Candidatus Melainabacteria bacterium GWF2_37_15]|nr:MAG: 5'/3'-nucleotidase SurE [Candidatus Melainabacteria bacterium GWF2_37_15]
MRILLCNDDGIQSLGIRTLAQRLANEHEVYVVAPDRERSAAGHSLTLHHPLRLEETEIGFDKNIKAWATNGTPGDCVKLALNTSILDKKPDLLISGINNGPNLGADILYSGTVSAAMEGAVLGYPSIAVSLCDIGYDSTDLAYSANFIAKFVPKIAEINFPKKTILNINIPTVNSKGITGIQITKLGTRMYTDKYEKRIDPRGKVYYWLAGELTDTEEDETSDVTAIRNNKISITPITFEMTHKSIMPELEQAFCNGKCNIY